MITDAVQGKDVDECVDANSNCGGRMRCLNGGTCSEPGGAEPCNCPKGWTGQVCEIRACPSNPCHEGSTCLMSPNDQRHCLCPYGKTGAHCDVGQSSRLIPFAYFAYSWIQLIQLFDWNECNVNCRCGDNEGAVWRDADRPLVVYNADTSILRDGALRAALPLRDRRLAASVTAPLHRPDRSSERGAPRFHGSQLHPRPRGSHLGSGFRHPAYIHCQSGAHQRHWRTLGSHRTAWPRRLAPS